MIKAEDFTDELKKNNLGPIIEVPCSIFKDLINYLLETKRMEVLNPVNEAIVMANAAGEYISTKEIPIVMMQNSGLNNTLNSLTSLNKQYEIPCVYLISWRGELKDAPEHNFMGNNLKTILDAFQIPFRILTNNYKSEIEWASSLAKQIKNPVALVMRKDFIDKFEKQKISFEQFSLDRWEAIETIVDNSKDCVYISTNGFPSRMLYNILKQKGEEDGRAFFMVGSMGHALGMGERIAQRNPQIKVIVIDGDGGTLMHLGSMAGVSKNKLSNLIHIILDNEVYGSTGTQPTLSPYIDFKKIGEGFGYNVYSVKNKEELISAINNSLNHCPSLIHIKINQKERTDKMKRVEHSCNKIKERFENYLNKTKLRW